MLFDYPGSKLKVFAKIMFWIMVAASVITGIVVASDWDEVGLLFPILIGGILVSYFTTLPLVALGEVCEEIGNIKYHTSRLNKELIDSKIKK